MVVVNGVVTVIGRRRGARDWGAMKHMPGAVTSRRVPTGAAPRSSRLLAILAIVTMFAAGGVIAAPAAWATDYPSWNDVLAARNNETAKKAEVARVQSALAGLEAAVATTQDEAQKKGALYQDAQLKFDEAAYKADELKKQADDAQAKAAKSKQRAGQLAAQLARSGGGDLTATLFFSGDNADNLLSQLGLASVVKDQSQGLYSKAIQDQNTAQSMTDAAVVAKNALKALAEKAQAAQAAAQAAADAATAALATQQANKARLDAQLATLQSDRVHTEEEYTAGIKALWGAGAGLGAGAISSSGWARPAAGPISSNFGPRIPPCSGCSSFHAGTDIAAGCNSPIYAAHSGTVVYAGWNGGYGNFIQIANDDGTGISSAYGHIVAGGTLVTNGQQVGVGQQIARVGSTGDSTGCHLHFEIRVNDVARDAVPFMRSQGIQLGS
jgi:murein DD-endopeptidase MepM/ murein hydrolase activator NlpD